MGSVFGQLALEAPAYAASVLSFLNVLLGFFILPEVSPKERRETTPMRFKDFNPIVAILEMGRKPGLGWLLVIFCLFNLGFNGISSTTSLFVIQKFDAEPWQVGSLLVSGGIALAVVQFLLLRRLVPRFGEKALAIASLLGQALCSLATFFAPLLWLLYPINMLNNSMSGFTFPTLILSTLIGSYTAK